jgi:hypothetical protein
MGKKPDDIQGEIKAKRRAINNRIVALENRAGDDVNALRQGFLNQANDFTEKAGSFFKVPEAVRERPYTTLLGAAGLGIALGLAQDRSGKKSASNGYRFYEPEPEPNQDRLPGLIGSLLGVATNTMQDEVRRFVREGFAQIRTSANRPATAPGDGDDRVSQPSRST